MFKSILYKIYSQLRFQLIKCFQVNFILSEKRYFGYDIKSVGTKDDKINYPLEPTAQTVISNIFLTPVDFLKGVDQNQFNILITTEKITA